MRPAVLLSLAAVAGLAACGAPATSSSSTDVAAIGRAIDSLDTNVQRWLNAGMTDSAVAGYYTSDAVSMVSNSPAAKGSEEIRNSFNELFKAAAIHLHFQRSMLVAADSLASDQGHYTIEIRDKKDTSKVLATDHGSHVTTFVKRNGQWRALYDIASSEMAPPSAAPGPASAKEPSTKK